MGCPPARRLIRHDGCLRSSLIPPSSLHITISSRLCFQGTRPSTCSAFIHQLLCKVQLTENDDSAIWSIQGWWLCRKLPVKHSCFRVISVGCVVIRVMAKCSFIEHWRLRKDTGAVTHIGVEGALQAPHSPTHQKVMTWFDGRI